jgi:hypothetical protein
MRIWIWKLTVYTPSYSPNGPLIETTLLMVVVDERKEKVGFKPKLQFLALILHLAH